MWSSSEPILTRLRFVEKNQRGGSEEGKRFFLLPGRALLQTGRPETPSSQPFVPDKDSLQLVSLENFILK